MKQLIVHIGPRKTGSTSIQRTLGSYAKALSANGVQVPVAGSRRRQSGCHEGLLRGIRAAQGPRPDPWDPLADEIRRVSASRIVISAEDFASPAIRDDAAVRLADFGAPPEPGAAKDLRPANRRRGAKETEVRRLVRQRAAPEVPEGRLLWPGRRGLLTRLPDLIEHEFPFAPPSVDGIQSLETRFASATRLARDYAVAGVLFRDPPDAQARPSAARWCDSGVAERR